MKGKKTSRTVQKTFQKTSVDLKKDSLFLVDKKLIIFILKFFLIFFILSLVVDLLPLNNFTNLLANISGFLLGLLVNGNIVYVNGASFTIGNMCTGLVSASILGAIIFSLNKPTLDKKLTLFAAGVIILLLVNIPRLILVLYSAKIGFDAELVHELTWFLMSAIVLAIWYYGYKTIFRIKDFNELL